MKRPPPRRGRLPRLADPAPGVGELAALARHAAFRGSPKHKLAPQAFGLAAYPGERDDATLCDRDAGFTPEHAQYIRSWMTRGIMAGLVSRDKRAIWAVSEAGWVFEGRQTSGCEFHGFPLMPGDPAAEIVYDRFKQWVQLHPKKRHHDAALACAHRYRFKP